MTSIPAPRYSVIVPVYNRRDEVADLLRSLAAQTEHSFETIIVEDGSPEPCRDIVEKLGPAANARYIFRPNEGRSPARNAGIEQARGQYLIFFDSDCVIPPSYFATLSRSLDAHPLDCFGGPDGASESFTPLQRAISVAMTSMLTTGGIRGRRRSLESFTPRSFNMGFSREVAHRVGGFREMFSEDIDISTRIRQAGFSIGLIPDAMVWHKRRVSFPKFFRQVHVFGMSRITLHLLYPGSLKAVHLLPAIAVAILLALILLAIFVSPWWLLPLALYALALFIDALRSSRSLKIALLALPASAVQIIGYGTGFIRAWVNNILLGRGRDLEQEINLRRGK
ncbi:MAG: glycosyltransferase [Pseudoflavonifractor sp.]|nr:glycosyltransferase [Alloprevotella sp.]MCM1116327.1 glycosyltransferase [Pseudoflavonifractor sp.]